ncbi:putative Epididymal secretory protein E1 [Hypsibius exemplaris]|uniref:Epididymal secretory protein E1 n=1 Tax=Hypsibius exemplaris TaxID=2072580 RepID=A0A1W0WJ51_HYPEX|nr:putative Epididymal secretory protein E1 [Hypsibius exemplaris]
MWQILTLLTLGMASMSVQGLQMPCHNCDGKSVDTCKTVEIEPCAASPCSLAKGTTVKFSVSFVANKAANNLTADVHAQVFGAWMPFSLPNPDGCQSGIQCPVQAGQTYSYQNQLAILPLYPSMNVVVKWSLKDEDNNEVFCVVMPARIV